MGATQVKGSVRKDDRPFYALDDEPVVKRITADPMRPFYALVKFQPVSTGQDWERGGEVTQKVKMTRVEVYPPGADSDEAEAQMDRMYRDRTGANPPPPMAFQGMKPDGTLTGVAGEPESDAKTVDAVVVDEGEAKGPWPGDVDYVAPPATFSEGDQNGGADGGDQGDGGEPAAAPTTRKGKTTR
jgi:hypothetical protein